MSQHLSLSLLSSTATFRARADATRYLAFLTPFLLDTRRHPYFALSIARLTRVSRIYISRSLRGFLLLFSSVRFFARRGGLAETTEGWKGITKEKDDAGWEGREETGGGAGHCMLVTLKFRPRTTFPKSATGEKGEWQGEAELSKFGFIRRAASWVARGGDDGRTGVRGQMPLEYLYFTMQMGKYSQVHLRGDAAERRDGFIYIMHSPFCRLRLCSTDCSLCCASPVIVQLSSSLSLSLSSSLRSLVLSSFFV